jgi:hypothetical protein
MMLEREFRHWNNLVIWRFYIAMKDLEIRGAGDLLR